MWFGFLSHLSCKVFMCILTEAFIQWWRSINCLLFNSSLQWWRKVCNFYGSNQNAGPLATLKKRGCSISQHAPFLFGLATGRLRCLSALSFNQCPLPTSQSEPVWVWVLFYPPTGGRGQRSDPQTVLNSASWCSALSTGFLLGQCPGMQPILDLLSEIIYRSLIKSSSFSFKSL